ncbi:hypothetical protein P7K49_016998 [Saguinus oedipus]|uniref:Uncharacterized protein n=1 Tax=Saguinus oedipus TaxID=9490 RepID=A0ABQ9V1B4_SAGOE|nr:hypothetical protein P7K49_016998 [Saguinus oedipus]
MASSALRLAQPLDASLEMGASSHEDPLPGSALFPHGILPVSTQKTLLGSTLKHTALQRHFIPAAWGLVCAAPVQPECSETVKGSLPGQEDPRSSIAASQGEGVSELQNNKEFTWMDLIHVQNQHFKQPFMVLQEASHMLRDIFREIHS